MSRHRHWSSLFVDCDRMWMLTVLPAIVIVRSHHECFLRRRVYFVLLRTSCALNSLPVYLVREARQLLLLIAAAIE